MPPRTRNYYKRRVSGHIGEEKIFNHLKKATNLPVERLDKTRYPGYPIDFKIKSCESDIYIEAKCYKSTYKDQKRWMCNVTKKTFAKKHHTRVCVVYYCRLDSTFWGIKLDGTETYPMRKPKGYSLMMVFPKSNMINITNETKFRKWITT